jgi:predicted RNA-binding protein with RPS1 domain
MSLQLQANDTPNGELSKTEKSELIEKVVKLLVSKEKKGWKGDELKKDTFTNLAGKFGLSESTIKNTYYGKVIPIVQEGNDKKQNRTANLKVMQKQEEEIQKQDEDKQTELILNEIETIVSEQQKENDKNLSIVKAEELDEKGRPLKPPYKTNDFIEVKVSQIASYGVFCTTFDEYEYRGLLHISEIKDIFIDDANDYFEIGEVIKVKVLLAQPNRLNFSTRGLIVSKKVKKKEETEVANPVKNPPINSIGEQFGKQLKNTIITTSVKGKKAFKDAVDEIMEDDKANIDQAEIEELFAEQIKEEEDRMKQEEKEQHELAVQTTEIIPSRVSDRDIADVQIFLNNKIGALSPNAQSKLVQILEKQGMFKSTMAISKVSEDFVVDYGLIFMEMVARELEKDECL